jgi:hypothetical protein
MAMPSCYTIVHQDAPPATKAIGRAYGRQNAGWLLVQFTFNPRWQQELRRHRTADEGDEKPVAMSLYRLGTHTSDSSIFYMFGLVGQAPVSRLPGHRPAMALETDCHERTDHRR